jgi:hypothetical protein
MPPCDGIAGVEKERAGGADGAGVPLTIPAADGLPGGPWVNWLQACEEANHDIMINPTHPNKMFLFIFILLHLQCRLL